ncbi:MAG TPA: hypothetical protein VLX92_06315 [Kofleriaceae bacterium]|nr:hypothetical protein [Kofleriaceae bacterium]
MRALPVCLIALAGCDALFGLDTITSAKDAAVADAAFDAPPDGPCPTQTVDVIADAILYGKNQQQDFSTATLMNLDTSQQAEGLVKFDVSGLAPGYTALTVNLPFAAHDDNCNGGCSSCAPLDRGGSLAVFAVAHQWAEATGAGGALVQGATWMYMYGKSGEQEMLPWQVPGALGQTDRSPMLAVFEHDAATDSSFTISGAAVTAAQMWIGDGDLGFVIVPITAEFVVRTHEHTCDPGEPAATLVASYCGP